MASIRKMPIGIQDFESLRTDEFMYVDKTMYIQKMLDGSKPYFWGRPRRFGKSLFLSTLVFLLLGQFIQTEDKNLVKIGQIFIGI